MTPVILGLPGNDRMAGELADQLKIQLGQVEVRSFPDGETYLRLATPVKDRSVILVCTLDRPDTKILPLLLLAAAVREQGAKFVGLVCPYLAYMRQDRRFKEGEVITSQHFARILERDFDYMVTVDPHLHRRSSLSEIYSIQTDVVHAGPLISDWISAQIEKPLLVGPDEESRQWVASTADEIGAQFVVLEKTRTGDRRVSIESPELRQWQSFTPVLVDDIISSGQTMIETIKVLKSAGLPRPVCIGIHGIFADDCYEKLGEAGAKEVVTCNTVVHPSNTIDVSGLLVPAIRSCLQE